MAHGWLHVDRVRRLAVAIAQAEGIDPWLAALAALLHDVGRSVPGPDAEHGLRSSELAALLLRELGVTDVECHEVLHAVRWHNSTRADRPLLCLLRDADMLDGMGAIGLMRAFMSKHMLPPYDPGSLLDGEVHLPPACVADQIEFQMTWMEQMSTETGRALARYRLEFVKAFAEQMRREVDFHLPVESSAPGEAFRDARTEVRRGYRA